MVLPKVRHLMARVERLCSSVRLLKCDGFNAISSVISAPSFDPNRPPAK